MLTSVTRRHLSAFATVVVPSLLLVAACGSDEPNEAPPPTPRCAVETCNGVDDDCNGQVDNGVSCPVAGTSCQAGSCLCPDGGAPCGDSCPDRQNDPLNCGACESECFIDGYCEAGTCL